MRSVVLSLSVLLLGVAAAPSAAATLTRSSLAPLLGLTPGAEIELPAFPIDADRLGTVRFKRIEVYAEDAELWDVSAAGAVRLERPNRRHYIGRTADGRVRLALSLEPDGSALAYTSFVADRVYLARAEASGAWTIVEQSALLPPGAVPRMQCNVGSTANPVAATMDGLSLLLTRLGVTRLDPEAGSRAARVAVDTDNEFNFRRFNNNVANANSWIADLFTTMNVMYERDLDLTLVIGQVFIRRDLDNPPTFDDDPYNNTDFPASQATLVEFGNHWQANHGSVPRAFAMLLSGKATSGNQAAGIAWIDSYCQNQGFGGSYSVNQIFTNPAIGVGLSANIVGHELGHNFGALHTHCTDTSPAPGLQPIDQCFNAEPGCYTGTVSCPGGPGSIMSYCNFGPPSGANCGQNQQVFHPFHISLLNTRIAANFPACITPNGGGDQIFRNGFEP